MAKKAQRNLVRDWEEIDPSTLQPNVAKAYDAYKALYAKAKALKAAFEAEASAAVPLPTGLELVFGYNFGKLSIAVGEKQEKKASSKAIAFGSLLSD